MTVKLFECIRMTLDKDVCLSMSHSNGVYVACIEAREEPVNRELNITEEGIQVFKQRHHILVEEDAVPVHKKEKPKL